MSRLDEQQHEQRRRQAQAADRQIAKRERVEEQGGVRQGVGATPNGIIFTNLALINF